MKVYYHTPRAGEKAPVDFPFVDNPLEADYILVTGGDGSILHTLSFLVMHGITNTPIIGYNTGHVGFLSNDLAEERLLEILENGIHDNFIEERTVLHAHIDGYFHAYALNDFVFQTMRYGKLFELNVVLDGETELNYKGDGLIVSTATGSTAYNLTAGGPIIEPTLETTTLTPICPFTLAARPLVMAADVEVKVIPTEQCALSTDGSVTTMFHEAYITKAPFKMKLIKLDFFHKAIQEKLGWNKGIR